MIIDDEPLVRETLCRTIDWKKYDCEIVAEAEDGSEAIEIYKASQPDIIITDIVMPFTTGLDLISEVKAINPDVEIIILSGYDNFEYAQTALNYHVSAYLLKPVSDQAIIEEILKIKKKIEQNKKAEAAIHAQSNTLKNNFLFELLGLSETDSSAFVQLCEAYHISFPSDRYSVAIFQVDKEQSINMSSALIQLKEAISYHISIVKDYVLTTNFNNMLVVLYVYSPLSDANDICVFLKHIQSEYKNTYHHTVTIGTSGIFKNISIIKRAYHQAVSALKQKALFGPNSIIQYTDIATHPEQAVVKLNFDNIKKITDCIKLGKTKEAVEEINIYFDKIGALKTVNIDLVINDILELVITLIRKFLQNSAMTSLVFGKDFFPAAELQNMEFLNEIHDWVNDVLLRIGKYYDLYISCTNNKTLNKALIYIQRNYASKITLDDVAKHLLISTRSLSRLFISETGKSFSENLTEYRIKMAIHLIESKQYKIIDIAAMVGYKDSKHFYKTFKKVTGHTPMYYKDSETEEE